MFKKVIAMMIGSGVSSVLNLIALTVAASRVDLEELDVYFVYRDFAESILKILFVSQIGPICIALLRISNNPELTIRKILVFGGAFTGLTLSSFLIFFPHASPYFLRSESLHLITGFSELEIAIIIFCLLMWLDSIVSTVLVQRRLFLQNHVCNIISAALLCFLIISPSDLTVAAMAIAYAFSKVAGTAPKILICCFPLFGKMEQISQFSNPFSSEGGASALNGISSMVLSYTPSNLLLLVNKSLYLAGTAFLAPGLFAIYSIYYRYYTALQNLITVNIFNLSASRLTCADSQQRETDGLIYRHALSFLIAYCGASIVMFLCSLPVMYSHLPEFLTSSYATILWSVVLLNFLPDGINYILSRRNMLQNNLEHDSRLNFIQAMANLSLLYPSMRLFGIVGLLYATVIICAFFSAVRLWYLYRNVDEFNSKVVLRFSVYGISLLALSVLSLVLPAWLYCLVAFTLSGSFLFHLLYSFRSEQ